VKRIFIHHRWDEQLSRDGGVIAFRLSFAHPAERVYRGTLQPQLLWNRSPQAENNIGPGTEVPPKEERGKSYATGRSKVAGRLIAIVAAEHGSTGNNTRPGTREDTLCWKGKGSPLD
jgi:hypothetical protein